MLRGLGAQRSGNLGNLLPSTWFFMERGLRRNARAMYIGALGQLGVLVPAYFSSLCCGVGCVTLGRFTSLPSTLVLYVAGFGCSTLGQLGALGHVYLVLCMLFIFFSTVHYSNILKWTQKNIFYLVFFVHFQCFICG